MLVRYIVSISFELSTKIKKIVFYFVGFGQVSGRYIEVLWGKYGESMRCAPMLLMNQSLCQRYSENQWF